MIDIIIVGYPKSGNTWVTRLVAELVGCPVVGFLGSKHDEIAREGLDRTSDYQCFKAHHQLFGLWETLRKITTNTTKIIYVVRDPRDICLSGSAHFRITLERMVHAVLYGSKEVHMWVRVPWRTHSQPYLENHYFFVKYEDLLGNPTRECQRIVRFLGVHREEHQIHQAIENQSFENKKAEFLKNNEPHKAEFMRVGKSEQWRHHLPKKYKSMFYAMLADELHQLGYPSDG